MPTDGDDEVPATTDGPTVADTTEDVDVVEVAGAPGDAEAKAKSAARQLTATADARQQLWPWVARRTRPQIIALVLISLLALGPVFALVSILRADPTPINTVLTAPQTGPEVTRIMVTAIRVSPTSGEMQTRIAITPFKGPEGLLDAAGKLKQPVSVSFNGAQGTSIRTFQTGEIPSTFEASVILTEGATSRYPFDQYQGATIISVTAGDDEERVPTVIEASSIVTDFDLSASPPDEVNPAGQSFSAVGWTATRPSTTTIYAVWLMILMWGLAVTGLLLVWAVVIWMVDLPFWAVGYLVGVLFALPQLRDSLPGRPPPGTIFDYGSFYWSVTIVGVSLILVLVVWLRRVRDESRLRSLDATKDA